MKKILSVLISVTILLTSTNIVFADEEAFNASLAKVDAAIDYLNEVYLVDDSLAFDVDYCSPEDLEMLTRVASTITDGCTTDLEKTEAIYNWMITNISYGSKGFSPIDVFRNKEGLCSGQAQLMSTLFRLSGVRAAVTRASKQGTKNIESLELSNSYMLKNAHEFVMAYVDGGWYGYDSTWGSSQPGVWHKMDRERIADQYMVLHLDGVLYWSEEAWSSAYYKPTDVFYKDNDYIVMKNGQQVLMGGSNMQVGGCLIYEKLFYYEGASTCYEYLGENVDIPMTAFDGGYYKIHWIAGKDIIKVKNNGIVETSYYDYNGETYFDGVKVDNIFEDNGLTDNSINVRLGDTIDLSLYAGYTFSSDCLTIDNTIATATTLGNGELTISSNDKNYTIDLYVYDELPTHELLQSCCNHDHTHIDGESEICDYCGKEIIEENPTEDPIVEESEVEEEPIVEQEQVETIEEKTIQEEVKEEIVEEQPVAEELSTIQETIEESIVEEVVEQSEETIETTPLEPVVAFNPSNEIVIEPIYEETTPIETVEEKLIDNKEETTIETIEEPIVEIKEEIVYNDIVIEEQETNNSYVEELINSIKLLFVAMFESIRKLFRSR